MHFILLKMRKNKHLRWEISTNKSCFWFATHFDDKPKILTYRQVSPNIFFPKKVSYENESQAKCNWILFKEAKAYKRGIQYYKVSEFDNIYAL